MASDETSRAGRRRPRVDYTVLENAGEALRGADLSANSNAPPRWVPHILQRPFAAAETLGVLRFKDGTSLTAAWQSSTGLRVPAVIEDSAGLGIVVPGADFGVRSVASVIGEKYPVAVIRVSDQSQLKDKWALGEWADYFDGFERKQTLNVISLEFSQTALANAVAAPAFVRENDWIDAAWPAHRRERGEYPRTQQYCLMSVAGCYTDFHVDFGGTAVWYHVLRGSKVFYLIAPTAAHLERYEQWVTSSDQDGVFLGDALPNDALQRKCARLELKAGQTLLLPSAWIHAVYTPQDSLVFGGNFLHAGDVAASLGVHALEGRTRLAQKFRFPFYSSLMFYGLAKLYDDLQRHCATQYDVSQKMTTHEREGAEALLRQCRVWAEGGPGSPGMNAAAVLHAAEAAAGVGFESPLALVAAARALIPPLIVARKLTIRLPASQLPQQPQTAPIRIPVAALPPGILPQAPEPPAAVPEVPQAFPEAFPASSQPGSDEDSYASDEYVPAGDKRKRKRKAKTPVAKKEDKPPPAPKPPKPPAKPPASTRARLKTKLDKILKVKRR